jgi:hypothetical protein
MGALGAVAARAGEPPGSAANAPKVAPIPAIDE